MGLQRIVWGWTDLDIMPVRLFVLMQEAGGLVLGAYRDNALVDMGVLEPGEKGEVCIGGASLARGYIGQPAMTAERFVPSSVLGASERVFRIGDVGLWRADGTLQLIGRCDLQVKSRGFRVEIEEVEAALRACVAVSGAATRAEYDERDARLVLASGTHHGARPVSVPVLVA